jgi:hypothetical protein
VAWIEQGREVRASAETLARLADGLNLTRAERAYLSRWPPATIPPIRLHMPPPRHRRLSLLVQGLAWPAYGLDAAWNVCCANTKARHLFVGLFAGEDQPNLLRYIFTKALQPAL